MFHSSVEEVGFESTIAAGKQRVEAFEAQKGNEPVKIDSTYRWTDHTWAC